MSGIVFARMRSSISSAGILLMQGPAVFFKPEVTRVEIGLLFKDKVAQHTEKYHSHLLPQDHLHYW